jgi:Bacterial Ig-like domain (group 3)/Glycine rich protein
VEGPVVKLQSLNLRRIVASSATVAVLLGAAGGAFDSANAASGPTCDASSCTETFYLSGATETFTVPTGVTALTVAVSGASGGWGTYGLPGGAGATVSGVLPVTPSQVLTVLAGQAGTGSGGQTFGGGGASASFYEASGGGGSFIFDAAGDPLVAAGGGGGGSYFNYGGAGAGAGSTGGSGTGCCGFTQTSPTGGTPTSAGVHGNLQATNGGDGSGPAAGALPGQGGDGGGANYDWYDVGGGGGGGYYGGGGGAYAQSGAGGSGYADSSITNLTSTDGANGGDGVVSISWALAPATVALSPTPSVGSTAGDAVTLTAAVSGSLGTATGTVEFDANGTAIEGCSAQPVTNGVATCATTALAAGSDTLQASYSGDTTYAATTSDSASYPVAYPALSVTTTSLPSGQVDETYSTDLTATGGLAPYTWSVFDGALPQGLALSTSGTISGTPSAADSNVTFIVQATDAQGTAYTANEELSIGVARGSQETAFTSTAPVNAKVDDTYSVTATGGKAGTDVTFSADASTTSSACSVSGSTVTFDHVGTCVVDADQSGDDNYSAATSDQQEIVVGSAAQVITFTSPVPTPAIAGTHQDVTTTGGKSGNAVVLSVDATTTNSACSTSGSTVSFDHAGTCVVDADQAANADYTAAVTAQESIVVTTVSAAVSVTSSPTVFGQAVHVTATVTDGGGNPDGTVQFAVNGNDLGTPVAVTDGSAQSPALTAPGGGSLSTGGHDITASYSPTDQTVYAGATGSATQVVDQAATTTTVNVSSSSISATVTPVAPGAGAPSGPVTFSVAGQTIGTANLVDGAAVFPYVVPTGMTHTVAAVYAGDDSFTASSDSTSRSDPSITATVTSAHPKSASGWYRSPVTVTFHCTVNGAPLTGPCPDAVHFTTNGAGQSTTRTIIATDGGVATVTVGDINLDLAVPSVTVAGIKNGAGYGGKAPAAHCVSRDALSGVASCTITQHTKGTLTSYTASATDKAGNTTTAHGSYHVLSIYVQGAAYSGGAFTVRTGHAYTVVVLDQAGRPTYYDAAIAPHKPSSRDMAFNAAGHHRWALGVTLARSMRSHHYWYLGVKVGHTMHSVKVHVTG